MGKWEQVRTGGDSWAFHVKDAFVGEITLSAIYSKRLYACIRTGTRAVMYFSLTELAEAKAWVEAMCALGGTDG